MKRNLIWLATSAILTISTSCSSSTGPDNRAMSAPANAVGNSVPSANDPGGANLASQPGNFYDRTKRNRVDHPNAKPVPPEFRPAPENSESATTMTSDGAILEIRVFKGHPQLAKAEVSWLDPNEKLLKVYLKNGRIVEVKTDRVENLRTTPSIDILAVAGVRTMPNDRDPSRLVDRK